MIYRRRASPLHAARAGLAALWCFDARARRAVVRAPVRARGGAAGGCSRRPAAARVGREVGRALAWALPLALLVALINAIVDARRPHGRVRGAGAAGYRAARRDGRGARLRRRARAARRRDHRLRGASPPPWIPTSCCAPSAGARCASASPPRWRRTSSACWRATGGGSPSPALADRLARAARRRPRRRRRRARPGVRRRGHARGPRLRQRRAAAPTPAAVASRRRVRHVRARSRGSRDRVRRRRREGFDAYPRLVVPVEPLQLVLAAALVACVLLPFLDRQGSPRERARAHRGHVHVSGRARARAADVTLTSSPASSSCWPAARARASPRSCARRRGWCRTSMAASSPAACAATGSTHASTARPSWPPSPGRCSRTRRRRS